MEKLKEEFSISFMCRCLGVSRQGYYAFVKQPISQRGLDDIDYALGIKRVSEESGGTYGSPRIYRALKNEGKSIGENRVARLMRENGIHGAIRKRFRNKNQNEADMPVPNILNREFNPDGPNQRWATDITYLWTSEGWLYLCVVIDLYSRSVVGWSMSSKQNASMVIMAVMMALGKRGRHKGLIIHSDQGSQYTSKKYQRIFENSGIKCSMSRRGNCWDNACVESFFGTLKQELYFRRKWRTRANLTGAVFNYIEIFYNRKRMHSTLGFVSPEQFEQNVG